MSTRPVIDVTELPHHGFDTLDPVFWRNNFFLAIETSMFVILVATYFYVRQNFAQWPPALAQLTAPLKPLPDLGLGTANTILLLASCVPMILVDISARRGEQSRAQLGLIKIGR